MGNMVFRKVKVSHCREESRLKWRWEKTWTNAHPR